MTANAGFTVEQRDGRAVFVFAGRLEAASIGGQWRPAMRAARHEHGHELAFDLAAVTFCDVAGAAFLASIEAAHGKTAELLGASEQVRGLLDRARITIPAEPKTVAAQRPHPRDVIALALRLMGSSIAFVGEATVALLRLPAHRRMFRLPDLLRTLDQAGVRSMPLVLMLGYLIGLILAFQSAVPMRRFGADIFVANLVAISLLRELGPLLAAVILAGRTGSAFAAEIGTMKVNEEVDALVTMGLDPMTMLVLPRMLAAMLVMPVMALALDVAGMLGMATVMRSFGFPLVTIARQVQNWVSAADLYGGLFKAVCFGITVAAIGCRAGLATGVGPRAVGLSATAAVVGGIVATIVLDGVFALIFYRLKL
ncbi:MAG: MlaE family lipid ABC transporter permease subunit [Acetobacteraceae bacterium]